MKMWCWRSILAPICTKCRGWWYGGKQEVNLMYLCPTLLLQLNGVVPHDNLVLIKMRPDEHGRFGFNVKVRAEYSWDMKGKSLFCSWFFYLFLLFSILGSSLHPYTPRCPSFLMPSSQNPWHILSVCIMTNSILFAWTVKYSLERQEMCEGLCCILTMSTCVSVCVQGGADQKMPIIVSRVAPGTSVSSQPQHIVTRWLLLYFL